MSRPSSPIEIINRLLNRGYKQTALRVLEAVSSVTSNSLIRQRLNELNVEAIRLAEAGEMLAPNNPVLVTFINDFRPYMQGNAQSINDVASALQVNGTQAAETVTRQLAFPGLSDAQIASAGIVWNSPNPEAIASVVDFVQSPAWAREISRYPNLVLDVVQNQAIRGIAEGWNPRRTAQMIADSVSGVPSYYAETLMRTLQLQSYRRATAAYQAANSQIIERIIRIASLDDRTCLACVALHGTEIAIGEVVLDHHNGRCTSVTVVRGRDLTVRTGVDWFNGLPSERQKIIAGKANYQALEDGEARLEDFVGRYDDPVYGEMINQRSLVSLLGRRGKASDN
jgi:hypothetical protein